MEDIYVTELTARILREAGFNLSVRRYYKRNLKNGKSYMLELNPEYITDANSENFDDKDVIASAPTRSDALKWLRDKNVFIWTTPVEVVKNDFFVPISINTNKWETMVWVDRKHFASAIYGEYEDAEDAGIRSGASFVKELNL